MMKRIHIFLNNSLTILMGLLLFIFISPMGNTAKVFAAGSAPQILTGLTTAGEDSVNVGIAGTYLAGQKAALDRINEIRYEACQKGYPDPRDESHKLTPDDYVPIKWSSELEAYARIRAAEAVVYTEHSRPGSNVNINPDVSYTTGSAEVLAWPGGTLKGGVELWYGEKDTWVKQESGVTGHYTSMINPANTHVGLGGFLTNSSQLGSGWGGCICGRFLRNNSNSPMDETMAKKLDNVIQIISVKKKYLSEPLLMNISESGDVVYQGDTIAYAVVRKATFSDNSQAYVLDMNSYTYTSSAKNILAVTANGKAEALKAGKAKIKAKGSDGKTYTKTVKVKSYIKTPTLSKVTVGKKTLKASLKAANATVSYATGFEVQVARDRKFKKSVKSSTVKPKIVNWSIVTSYSKIFKKLKSKKTYYVRVRAYIKNNGKKYYTSWSKVKKAKVK